LALFIAQRSLYVHWREWYLALHLHSVYFLRQLANDSRFFRHFHLSSFSLHLLIRSRFIDSKNFKTHVLLLVKIWSNLSFHFSNCCLAWIFYQIPTFLLGKPAMGRSHINAYRVYNDSGNYGYVDSAFLSQDKKSDKCLGGLIL
jgi:hypothetical protein